VTQYIYIHSFLARTT